MGGTLFGSEQSGTPLETRGAVEAAGKRLETAISSGGLDALLGLGGPGAFGELSLEAVSRILEHAPQLAEGLFKTLEPFERRTMDRAAAGIRSSFGSAGGRFSESLLQAEGETRGEVAGQLARARQEAILSALGPIIQAANVAQQGQLGQASILAGLLRPGDPIFKEGIAPGLIGAGANIGAAAAFGGK